MAERTVKGTLEWDVSDLLSGTDKGVQALRDTADAADRAEQAMDDGFAGAAQSADGFRDSIARVSRDFSGLSGIDLDLSDDEREFSRLSDSMADVADGARRSGKVVGDELSDGMDRAARASGDLTAEVESDADKQKRSWRDVAGEARGYAGELGQIGSLAGAGVLGAVTVGLDNQAGAAGRLQAQLGLTADEAERFEQVGLEVYTDNFGDSLVDAGDTVALIATSLRDLTDDELTALAEGVMATEDAFGNLGADVPIIAEDLRTMKANFPDRTELELLDMIVQSFQDGTGNAGDLQDTLQEYPGDFAALGFSAEDMFGILNAGMESGIRNTDLVAEAFRELGLLIGEEGGKAEEALAGMFGQEEADRLQAAFAEGGEAARDAFFEITEGLLAIQDPQEQFNTGVEIMGTKFEDSRAQMPQFLAALSDVGDGTVDAAGSVEELNAQYDNSRSKMETLRRQLTSGVIGTIGDLGGEAAEAATGVGTLVLGLSGIGVDASAIRSVGALGGKLALYAGYAVGVGLAASALADMVGIGQDVQGLGNMTTDLEVLAKTGESQGLEQSAYGVEGLAKAFDYLAEPSLAQNVGAFGSRAVDLAGQIGTLGTLDVRGSIVEAERSVSALDSSLAGMVQSGNLETAGQAFEQVTDAAADQGVEVEQVMALLPGFADQLSLAGISADDLATAGDRQAEAAGRQAAEIGRLDYRGLADTSGEAARQGGELATMLLRANSAAADGVQPTRDLRNADADLKVVWSDLETAGESVEAVLDDVLAAKDRQAAASGDLAAADRNYEQSLDDMKTTLQETTQVRDDDGKVVEQNAADLRRHTQAGRDNEAAIWDVIDAANANANAQVESGDSIATVNGRIRNQRDNLIDVAQQFGISKADARKYADEILLIPNDAKTRAEFAAAAARESLLGWVEKIEAAPDYADTTARFFKDSASLESWLSDLNDIQRDVITRVKVAPGVSQYAEGTDYHPGGPAIINDAPTRIRGEFVNLPGGSSVTPSDESVDMLAEAIRRGGGTGTGSTATYNVYGDPDPLTMARLRAREMIRAL